MTLEQRVTFALLAVKRVCDDTTWNEWADNWLNGTDRSDSRAYYIVREVYTVNIAAHYAAWSVLDFIAGYNYDTAFAAANAVGLAIALKTKIDIKSILNQVFPKKD